MCTEAILYYICKDNQPFSTVDGKGFRYLISRICPLYKVPTRNTIKKLIDEKFNYISMLFKNKISKAENITITTDAWTDTNTMKSFLGITIHFLIDCIFYSGIYYCISSCYMIIVFITFFKFGTKNIFQNISQS